MEERMTLNGIEFAEMLSAGAAELRSCVNEINGLNVFPIPDGDTGNNMLLTVMGGVDSLPDGVHNIGTVTRAAADGMLFAARGNSGVILSQLFDGIAKGCEGEEEIDTEKFANAFKVGVRSAYDAVLKPTEGTILTVARCASENTDVQALQSPTEFLSKYITNAEETLERTPEMLPVLKKAGVIDSGGAGLVSILKGMSKALSGEAVPAESNARIIEKKESVDFDRFTEDDVLTYGYCTEVLLRLQNSKTNIDVFNVQALTEYLQSIGDSVVAFKNGTAVKVHVHTFFPSKVLSFCQNYGEFLTVKIENMSLQHSSTMDKNDVLPDRKRYGIVAVCTGEGIRDLFAERGVDITVDGGQSMNPSAEDFINAFEKINAEHIVVLPNNGNVVLTAQQAGKLYGKKSVHVLNSKSIGEGYAALSMMNPDEADVDTLISEMTDAMSGVVTAEISACIKNTVIDGIQMHIGDFIGVCGKNIVAVSEKRSDAAVMTAEKVGVAERDICLILKGKNGTVKEAEEIADRIRSTYKGKEVYTVCGEQEIYDYILILE